MDPQSKWRIDPIWAEITDKDLDGADWDGTSGSVPDVLVLMACPPSSQPHAVEIPYVESYTPTWTTPGCIATMQALLTEPFKVRVEDYDPVGSNDLVAEFPLQLSQNELSDQKEFTIIPYQALKSMTFRVTFIGN